MYSRVFHWSRTGRSILPGPDGSSSSHRGTVISYPHHLSEPGNDAEVRGIGLTERPRRVCLCWFAPAHPSQNPILASWVKVAGAAPSGVVKGLLFSRSFPGPPLIHDLAPQRRQRSRSYICQLPSGGLERLSRSYARGNSSLWQVN